MSEDIFQQPAIRETIKDLLSATRKKSDYLRVQCIWLRVECRMSADQVAVVTGLKPGTVRKIWSMFRQNGMQALRCREKGGRRNAYLSIDEERLFLSPFFLKEEKNGMLNVTLLKREYENRVGFKVPKSTIYRLLKRHGWKKEKRPVTTSQEVTPPHDGDMHDYWIEGCSQAILPRRPGNISQQWLNSTLSSLNPDRHSDP